jgi:predicted dehydrogenase
LEIAGLCDIKPENIDIFIEKSSLDKSGEIPKYTDYLKMIDEQEPDLVSIATNSGAHAEIALHCIDRGVPVIIEKPMAMNMKDANEIVRLSEEKGVQVAACHQNRFNVAIQELRKALEKGRFGKLSHGSLHVRWNRDEEYYKQAPWRGTWAEDGGALMNQCIHGIDLLRWVMGDEVDEVYGVTRRRFHPYIEAEDIGMAVIKFRNGAIATVEGTTNVFPKNLEETLYVFGERGTVKIGGTSANNIDVWEFADESEGDSKNRGLQEQTSNVYGNGHTLLFADMVEAIQEGKTPSIDARTGRNAVELVLAIYKSMKEGAPVKLPLEDFASVDMAGIF